ncbi:MAG: 50S ribosomal protein L10, partial [Methanolinea sp.]|nr:50S ribosomal protein L10 [Methanolinea sp.]
LYEGDVYDSSVLAIDETAILNQLTLAATQAFNLSVNAVILTGETAMPILTKAVREARGLAIEADVYEKDVIDAIIGKAYRQSTALRSMVEGK